MAPGFVALGHNAEVNSAFVVLLFPMFGEGLLCSGTDEQKW
jgi:hypothetical protein